MRFILVSLISALTTQDVSATFFTSEVSGMSDVGSGPAVKYDYEMEVPGTATRKCALVNIVMDESGSMTTEQTFMRDTAIPQIVSELYTATYGYSDVFVCSNGFGGYATTDVYDYRHIGCSRGQTNGAVDSSITAWNVRGHWEEGYYAMSKSMENVPQTIDGVNLNTECSELHKNMIMVSDEDRDSTDWVTTPIVMRQEIIDHGYILNIVVDSTINGDRANVGIQVHSINRNTVFQADGSGGFTSFDKNEPFTGFVAHEDLGVYTLDHYYPLIIGTGGAAWNVNSLREGVNNNNLNLRLSFTDAFVKTKVQEIIDSCSGNTCGGGGRSEIGGDPHITTWKNEHYEYHGQCDLVLLKDDEFADGLGLDIHIRTKVVRHWSYIQSVAIRIGNDVIEIEGSADIEDQEAHYWYNFEHQGQGEDLSGFKLIFKKQVAYKRQYIVDLSPRYPGKQIVIQLFKEFIRVKFDGSEEAFGNTSGLMGDFKSGKTLARDGVTELGDFTAFGEEWQVLPADGNLFHVATHPQFPEKCVEPEDPCGERRRRLGESKISYEQAEAACFKSLSDPLSIKDCVYDILATQDMDMVGAF